MPTLHDSGAEAAKISYLKNLMVSALCVWVGDCTYQSIIAAILSWIPRTRQLMSFVLCVVVQVNYLASDTAVREHMEPAIGTVLNFTDDDLAKIKKQKEQNDSWF